LGRQIKQRLFSSTGEEVRTDKIVGASVSDTASTGAAVEEGAIGLLVAGTGAFVGAAVGAIVGDAVGLDVGDGVGSRVVGSGLG